MSSQRMFLRREKCDSYVNFLYSTVEHRKDGKIRKGIVWNGGETDGGREEGRERGRKGERVGGREGTREGREGWYARQAVRHGHK
jgi:hypothetical protein